MTGEGAIAAGRKLQRLAAKNHSQSLSTGAGGSPGGQHQVRMGLPTRAAASAKGALPLSLSMAAGRTGPGRHYRSHDLLG